MNIVRTIVFFAIKHALLRFLSVASVGLIICGIGYSCYIAFWKPHHNPTPTQTQRAEQIQNTYVTTQDETFFVGIKIFGIKAGISKN